nr:unnamed protein product [Callosobruchus chinensis]
MNQIKTFHEKLYAVKDKVVQDTYILKCCHAEKPKKTDKNKARNNTVSISYKIPNEKGTLIRVCKNAFLGITGVSRFRIERVVKNFMNNSEVPKERRGGDRIGDGNKEKKNEIKKFIESLSCVESHYCRSKSSAVYHCLKNFHFKGSIQTVRLFADGCGGQNKNGTMMAMLSSWLLNDAPKTLNSIEIVFPIVGHSFMPPDRVFGLVEKSLKKKSMIINPEEYDEVIGTWSTIRKIDEWCILDWRNESKSHLKPPGSWHFQFNKTKRFILTRSSKANILVRGEPNYVTDIGEGKGICKKGKKNSLLSPSTIPFGRQLKGDKSSIDRLLCSHYGPSWKNNPELSLYKRFFDSICPEDSSTNGNVSSAAPEQCNNQEYIELEI